MLAVGVGPFLASASQVEQPPGHHPKIALISVIGCLDDEHIQTLRALGDVTVLGPLSEKQALDTLKGIDIVVASPYAVPLNKTVLESTDTLKLLVSDTTGLDRVDLAAASGKGIRVANVPNYSTDAVAEFTFGLLLAGIRHIPQAEATERHGQFETPKSDLKYVGFELAGKTLGVVGLGSIGIRVAEIGRGFGMNVIAWDRSPKKVDGITQLSLEQVLSQSDVVSLNLALNKDTAGIVNAAHLRLMKPTAILVNMARAELVDETALYDALHDGKIAGAALDVLTVMDVSNPLLTLDNVIVSPHLAYDTRESQFRCAESVVATVRNFIAGTPKT